MSKLTWSSLLSSSPDIFKKHRALCISDWAVESPYRVPAHTLACLITSRTQLSIMMFHPVFIIYTRAYMYICNIKIK